jgi:hypothetical protein
LETDSLSTSKALLARGAVEEVEGTKTNRPHQGHNEASLLKGGCYDLGVVWLASSSHNNMRDIWGEVIDR